MKAESIQKILLSLIMIFPVLNTSGQSDFINAAVNDYAAGLSINPWHSNSDIFEDGSDIYRVTVYSDANGQPGIAWRVHYNGNDNDDELPFDLGSIATATNAYFADVVLVQDPGNSNKMHAITA